MKKYSQNFQEEILKNKNFVLILFVVVISSVLFSSCVPSKPAYEEETLTANRLIKKLEANRRKIKTFSGTGVMDIESPKFGAKTTFEVALKKPDSIKVSIYGPFGLDLVEVLITKDDFTFYDVMKNRVYTGENRGGIIKEIFKVDLTFDDLMDAFAGAVNLTDKLRNEPDEYLIFEDSYKLIYLDKKSGKKSIYDIRADDLAVTKYNVVLGNKELSFEGTYRKFKNFESVPIPYKTVIESESNEQRIEIEYRKLYVNDELDPFTIDIPTDVEIIRW